eukprot:296770-Chlamydomonas_euryale.AAC.4
MKQRCGEGHQHGDFTLSKVLRVRRTSDSASSCYACEAPTVRSAVCLWLAVAGIPEQSAACTPVVFATGHDIHDVWTDCMK